MLKKLFLASSFFVCLPTIALAQSITLTSPTSTVTVKEGADFATSVLGNPWDFDTRRDIGWEENFDGNTVKVTNGKWTGKYQSAGGYVFPLFPGFKGSLFAQGLPGDNALPRLGINNKIKASTYSLLSFRLKQTNRSTLAVYWNSEDTRSEYWPEGSQFGAIFDGFFNFARSHVHTGYVTYMFDMKNLASQFAQKGGAWNGDIFALRIDPSTGGVAGSTTTFDWIRVVDPNSGEDLTFTWDTVGMGENDMVTLWVDTDASGFDGDPLVRFTDGSNPGTYTFNTEALPPGEYYFYLTMHDELVQTERARTGYSGKLVITARPSVVITSPSQITGTDYSTAEAGNPWDMNDATDVANLDTTKWSDVWRQFSNAVFSSGKFIADADPPLTEIGNTESDVQVHMNIPTSAPINTSKYRYFTYRMKVDATDYPTIADKVRDGWVSRPVFWNSDIINDAGRPKAHVVYENYNTYTIDLWDTSIIEAGKSWQSFRNIQNLRLDPLETSIPTEFRLDWVKLTSPNHTTNSRFEINFEIQDADSSTFTASLYYDTDNTGYNGRKITDLTGLSAGSHEYTWNTSSLGTEGSYYVYIIVSDGVNSSKSYSAVPILIDNGASLNQTRRVTLLDYDGDGTSDNMVYRPLASTFFLNSSNVGFLSLLWGDASFTPIQADFDGDLRMDFAMVRPEVGGVLHWYRINSSNLVQEITPWGLPGDYLVPGDYNGDGKEDIAVYRGGAWFILYADGSATLLFWGLPGDVPVPNDYDGDGKDDVAIWRPTDGMWWILNSGFTTGHASNYYTVKQWGLTGDTPIPADFDGDSKADFAVFRSGLGMWFVQGSVSEEITVQQWGLPGDIPMAGDFNGDGLAEYTVYREADGTWYTNFGNNTTSATQWGLPGDKTPRRHFN